MADHEPSEGTAEVASSQSTQSVPDANVTTEQESSDGDKHKARPKVNTDDAPKTSNTNGKDSKPATPRGRNGRRGRKEDKSNNDKENNQKEKDGESPVEGTPKKSAPYVNEDRFKTGGTPREKLSPEELQARMERIRLNNEKIKERRAAVKADEQAFYESQAALRERESRQQKIQANINERRAAVAKRKMENAGRREWDSFKTGADEGEGTNASMHAPRSPDVSSEWPADDTGNDEAKEGASSLVSGGETDGRGRGRGRGGGRGRGRGRGSTRGRGGRGGGSGSFNDSRRETVPHTKDKPEESADTSGGDWPGADEWGKDPYEIDPSQQHQETGIAITTNEADPWGTPADDPWGTANADDPWGPAPTTTAA